MQTKEKQKSRRIFIKKILIILFFSFFLVSFANASSLYSSYLSINHNSEVFSGPNITSASTNPKDVAPGGKMLVSVAVNDPSGVVSVIAKMPTEAGIDILNLSLVKGTIYRGTWQATWTDHDTLNKAYTTTVIVTNQLGQQSQKNIDWTDPGCSAPSSISLDSGTYSANVGGTFNVTVSGNTSATCSNVVQDNNGGPYVIVPSSASDLDCDGNTCSGTGTTLTETLKCESAGTYYIRGGNSTFSVYSSPSTVSCVSISDTATMSSTNFIIKDPMMGTLGDYGTSTNFQLTSSGNSLFSDIASSTNFISHYGFLYYPTVNLGTLTATPVGMQANLSWGASTAVDGWTVSGYNVGWSSTSGGPYSYTSVGSSTSYSYTGLSPGTYYYVVQTLDGLGMLLELPTKLPPQFRKLLLTVLMQAPTTRGLLIQFPSIHFPQRQQRAPMKAQLILFGQT